MSVILLLYLTPVRKYRCASIERHFERASINTSVSGEFITIFGQSWLTFSTWSKRRVSAFSWFDSNISIRGYPSEVILYAFVPQVVRRTFLSRTWHFVFHWSTINFTSIILLGLEDNRRFRCLICDVGIICCKVKFPLDLLFLSMFLLSFHRRYQISHRFVLHFDLSTGHGATIW